LLHGDDDEVVLGGDPVVGGGHAAPAEFPERGVFVPALVGGGADREAESEAGAMAYFIAHGDGGYRSRELVGAHEFDAFRFEVLFALEGAAVGDHLEEAGVVGDGGEEAAAAGLVGGFLEEERVFGLFEVDEEAGFGAEDIGETSCFFGGDVEAGVGHVEGGEEAFLEEGCKGLAGGGFDDVAEDVGIDTVEPLGAGLVEEGDARGGPGHCGEGFIAVEGLGFSVEFIDGVASPAVGESGGVAEEVADGGGGFGWDGVAVFLPDGEAFKLGEVLGDGVVEVELAFFAEHHGGGRGDALGHGVDTENGVLFDGGFGASVGEAELLIVDDVAFAEDEDGATDEFFIGDEFFDGGVDFSEGVGGHAKVLGLGGGEWF